MASRPGSHSATVASMWWTGVATGSSRTRLRMGAFLVTEGNVMPIDSRILLILRRTPAVLSASLDLEAAGGGAPSHRRRSIPRTYRRAIHHSMPTWVTPSIVSPIRSRSCNYGAPRILLDPGVRKLEETTTGAQRKASASIRPACAAARMLDRPVVLGHRWQLPAWRDSCT